MKPPIESTGQPTLTHSARRRWWAAAAVAMVLPLLAIAAWNTLSIAGASREVEQLFGGADALAIVRGATTASAYRLPKPSHEEERLARYRFTAGPVALPTEAVERLKRVLLDPRSYRFEEAKSCAPDYGVRLEFARGGERLDVLLCFGCDVLAVYHRGQWVGGEDFDDVRPRLLAIAKQAFPDDAALQSLE